MLVDNVLSVYRSASFDAFSTGLGWYDDAHRFAASLDDNIERAAGIVAALSPMSSWQNNKNKAIQFYWNGPAGCGLHKNVAKASRILAGEHPLDVLGGRKVRSFYLSIVDPNSPIAEPVIDRHAFDIAMGRVTSDKERATLSRKGEYDRFAAAYSESAFTVGVTPKQLQAITWVEWRSRKGLHWTG